MLVCLCYGISDRTIKQAIAEGASTPDEVGNCCGAGTDCGGCISEIETLLEEASQPLAPVTRLPQRPNTAKPCPPSGDVVSTSRHSA